MHSYKYVARAIQYNQSNIWRDVSLQHGLPPTPPTTRGRGRRLTAKPLPPSSHLLTSPMQSHSTIQNPNPCRPRPCRRSPRPSWLRTQSFDSRTTHAEGKVFGRVLVPLRDGRAIALPFCKGCSWPFGAEHQCGGPWSFVFFVGCSTNYFYPKAHLRLRRRCRPPCFRRSCPATMQEQQPRSDFSFSTPSKTGSRSLLASQPITHHTLPVRRGHMGSF
jgi:hypothetical protein